MIKNVSVKLFSFITGESIGDQKVSAQFYSFFNGGSIGDHERVCQNFSFINGGSIGDQERVCQTLQLLYWREYWWSRTCLSNFSASLMEGVLVIENVSVKLFSFFKNVSEAGSIGDQERVCQTLQLLQQGFPGTCQTLQGWSIGDEVLVRVCQTASSERVFFSWREYWWSRTCLSNSSAS